MTNIKKHTFQERFSSVIQSGVNEAFLFFADGMMQALTMLRQRQVVPTVQLGMRKSINMAQIVV